MSSIKLTADSGGGTFEIKAPSSSANTRVLTLPDTQNLTLNGGKVLQTVTASTTSLATTTGTTYEDTNLTASINIAANSKVLVLLTQNYELKRTKNFCAGDIRLVRGSTNIWVSANQKMLGFGDQDTDAKTLLGVLSICFLDTGATTGSNTYKTQQRVQSEDDTPRIRTQDDSNPSVITLLEIGA